MSAPYSADQAVGVYDRVPIRAFDEQGVEHDASEGDTFVLPPQTAASVEAASWGAGSAIVDVSTAVKAALQGNGGLKIQATNEALGLTAGEDPAPGVKKRLIVRYIEAFYVSPEDRLAAEGVDPATLEGKLREAEIKNERLIHENKKLAAQVVRASRWDNHYREVEDRLREEVAKRRQLEQAVYENEGSHVATRLRELEREATRLRNALKKEQDMVLDEQRQRHALQEEIGTLRDARGAGAGNVQQQVGLLRQENARIAEQLQEVNRLNTQLQLSIKEEADFDKLRADIYARDNVDPMTGRLPISTTHVQVRKSTLCSKCKSQVEMWERQALSRQMSAAAVRYGPQETDSYALPDMPSPVSPPKPLRTFGSPSASALYSQQSARIHRDPRVSAPSPLSYTEAPSSYPVQGPGYSSRGVTKI